MGIVSAFILGCLVTIWWTAKPNNRESPREVETVKPEVNGYLDKAKRGLRRVGQQAIEIRAARVPKKPVIDDEVKEILLEYAIDQVRKGKIKIVEDID